MASGAAAGAAATALKYVAATRAISSFVKRIVLV